MKETTLNDIMHFTLGKNPTRLKESDVNLYTPKDFDQDLLDRDSKDSREVCIINLIRSKAAPMSDANREKILTSNFLRCELDASLIDGWYFCYQFNDGNALSQQIAMVNQGTTLSVKKLNLKNYSCKDNSWSDFSTSLICKNSSRFTYWFIFSSF